MCFNFLFKFNLKFKFLFHFKIIFKDSRNRTHTNDFEDHCSTTKLYPLKNIKFTGLLPLWLFFQKYYLMIYYYRLTEFRSPLLSNSQLNFIKVTKMFPFTFLYLFFLLVPVPPLLIIDIDTSYHILFNI